MHAHIITSVFVIVYVNLSIESVAKWSEVGEISKLRHHILCRDHLYTSFIIVIS